MKLLLGQNAAAAPASAKLTLAHSFTTSLLLLLWQQTTFPSNTLTPYLALLEHLFDNNPRKGETNPLLAPTWLAGPCQLENQCAAENNGSFLSDLFALLGEHSCWSSFYL